MRNSIQIEEEAAAWLVKRDSGEWGAEDARALEDWLADTSHRVAFIRLEGAWRRAEKLNVLAAGTPAGSVPTPEDLRRSPYFDRRMPVAEMARPEEARPAPRRRARVALAASLIIALVVAGGWLLPAGSVYRTPVGGIASVPMSDGSKVTLNTDSAIRLALNEKERRVVLEQGEAFFEVAKDPIRPFVVEVGDRRVIAVGTKFSVRRVPHGNVGSMDEDVRVVVTEGQVRIEPRSARAEPPAKASAGTVAHAGDAGVVLEQRPLAEAEEFLSWRSGYLTFRDVALGDAVTEFNRYNSRQIVIQDPEVAAIRFSGNLRATNFDGFVRLLEEGFGVDAQRSDDVILLTRN